MKASSHIQGQIVQLAREAVAISEYGFCGEPKGFSHSDVSRFLGPLSVLAAEGDAVSADRFTAQITRMADRQWGLGEEGTGQYLNDMFCARSYCEALHGLIDLGAIDRDVMDKAGPWLHELAMMRCNGAIQRRPDFLQWHLRNQNVPATGIYTIAHLLDSIVPGRFDTAPLWNWADKQMVGWNLNWRTPDDSWLYQFIWIWGAYLHAKYRKPELLQSENARKSFDFYKHLSAPGGVGLVFGDCRPGDLLGPSVALLLGADLFNDGKQLWIAQEMINEAVERGQTRGLIDRGPEFFRLYSLAHVDQRLESEPPCRQSRFITSPLAGRGWSTGGATYNDQIKQADSVFPCKGENTHSWDAIYQVRDPKAYSIEKPDKFVFGEGDDKESMFALADLRAQGLHDHPDALNLCTLICDGLPWLVESTYEPMEKNCDRWLHNVPLVREGSHSPQALMTWESDTWREPSLDDVWFERRDELVIAGARLPADAFDYVPFSSDAFDIERFFIFHPNMRLLVVDRLIARRQVTATIGQVWHTPANVDVAGSDVTLTQQDRRMCLSSAHSMEMDWGQSSHEPSEFDGFYFPQDQRIQDVLAHAVVQAQAGDALVMAACFDRDPVELSLSQDQNQGQVQITAGQFLVQIGGFNDVEIRRLQPPILNPDATQTPQTTASP